MKPRPAIPIDPPAVPKGKPRCPCCSGPLGPPSWEIPVCGVCYEAQAGMRTDPTVYQVQGRRGGGWKTVKFARTHTICPLAVQVAMTAETVPGMRKRRGESSVSV